MRIKDFAGAKRGDAIAVELSTRLYVDAEGNAWLSDERGGGEPRVGVPEQIWHQVRHQLIATFGWGVILSADITLKGTMICGENLKLVISEAEEIWVREIESNS
jgi:hypothetical protein